MSEKKSGIIVIDKPKDFTSFDVVAVMRGILGQRKIGHTGTLDPMATGVLPIMVGKATKVLSLINDTDKEYIADFCLGISTDTQDITGNIISEKPVNVSQREVREALNSFMGEIEQIPPMYSAVRVNGKRLYELARKSIEVERKARKVNIKNIKLLSFDEEKHNGSFKVLCSQGTYVRTICDDLGKKLTCGATLSDLRRTKACSFTLNDAITLKEAQKLADDGMIYDKVKGIDALFTCNKSVYLDKKQAIAFQNGVALSFNDIHKFEKNDIINTYYNSLFLGFAKLDFQTKKLKVYKNLSDYKISDL